MKLLFSGNDYIHKVLVVAYEAGVLDRLEFVVNNPVGPDDIIWDYTPLGKHPVLVLEDGLTLYSGLLVCEYLDSLGPGPRLFPQDGTRWRALSQMVLGDGLFDAVSALSIDALKPAPDRVASAMHRNRRRILGTLDRMARAAAAISGEGAWLVIAGAGMITTAALLWAPLPTYLGALAGPAFTVVLLVLLWWERWR